MPALEIYRGLEQPDKTFDRSPRWENALWFEPLIKDDSQIENPQVTVSPRYLLEDYAVSYGASASVLVNTISGSIPRPAAWSPIVLALGDPIFPAELVAEGRISLPTPQSALYRS